MDWLLLLAEPIFGFDAAEVEPWRVEIVVVVAVVVDQPH